MHTSTSAVWLSVVAVLLAVAAAGIGLFWRSPGEPFAFTTLRDQAVQIYNQGIYRYDTLFFGAGFKGQDAVVLFLGVPLLILSILLYGRGSLLGGLLLVGTLGYLIALPLLVIIILLAPQIILSTVFQQSAGVPFTTAEMVGPVVGFVVLGLVAIWLLVTFLRSAAAFAQI